ncbi:hypothetical protein AN958_11417 [Leucoagaricus sp. SymC.cos]|nr:hypothetical protein AN958_11417 [Leucoagaricus sp. SymC.cos]
MAPNCFPALGFEMPSEVPPDSELSSWWCDPATEYAFMGFSYEVTDCQSRSKLVSEFKNIRNTFNSRYVRLYGVCDRTGFYDDIVEAAWQAGLGVHALIWFGFNGDDVWKGRRDVLLKALHSNPKAKWVTRVLQFGSEPLFDWAIDTEELVNQVRLAKKKLSSVHIPVTVSEMAYGYQEHEADGSQDVLDAIDSINIHMLPFFSQEASTAKKAWPIVLKDLQYFIDHGKGKKMYFDENGWPSVTSEGVQPNSPDAVADVPNERDYYKLLDSHCTDLKEVVGGGVGWFAHIYSDNQEPGPRGLSIIIPSNTTSVPTATGTAVYGNELYSQFTYQPYRSPVSPVSPLPYRPKTLTKSGPMPKYATVPPSLEKPQLNFKAEDIVSPNLLAVANLLSSMKETLGRMTRTFDVLGGQSQRLSSLPGEVKRVEDIRSIRAQLEEQIVRQNTEMQELRNKLEGDVRFALEEKLHERLAGMIKEIIPQEVEERVRRELATQILPEMSEIFEPVCGTQAENHPQLEEDYPSDPDTPLPSPEDTRINQRPRIPILLFQGPMDDEPGRLCLPDEPMTKAGLDTPMFSPENDSYPHIKIPLLLFDESREHEPPPPSPAPMAGPLRPLLRPLPSPEQSPAYVVHDILPSRSASVCATPVTAYPGVPASTPITSELIIMVYSLRDASASRLPPVSEAPSPLAPKNLDLLFALSSERNKEILKNHDMDGFVVPTPMAEWPKTRTILKTPTRSLRSSPLMVPPPLESNFVNIDTNSNKSTSAPESPTLMIPPPRTEFGANSTLTNNLKLLPPLIIT